jgi:eukaryotic-like serine/threonine-protein kinase
VRVGLEPVLRPPPQSGSDGILEWLDSLASGVCTPQAFSIAMQERFQGEAIGNWELLSLLDQYYRRGKIKPEVFQAVKSRLDEATFGTREGLAARAPPRAAPTVTTPVAKTRAADSTSKRAADAGGSRTVELTNQRPVGEPTVGDELRGRYTITKVLGRGGMGTVFEAVDDYRLDLPAAGRYIALKALHPEVAQRDELLVELQREFQHLQSLTHPHIVRVHEFDRDGDIAFFTMELLSGGLLSRVLTARNSIALPREHALAVIRDIGAALSHAHSRGVIHGDVNPQNVFITDEGDLRVLDFGASHAVRGMLTAENEWSQRIAVATPGYASCQVLEERRPDARDDLFAFACVSYVLLSGKHPFPDRSALQARAQKWRPRRPPGLTGHQWRALREGLRWDRERRPSDVRAWLDRFGLPDASPRLPPLAELVMTPAPQSRTPVYASAAVLLLALLAAGGYWAATNFESVTRTLTVWQSQLRPKAKPTVAAPALPAAQPSADSEVSSAALPGAAPPSPIPSRPPVAVTTHAAPPAVAVTTHAAPPAVAVTTHATPPAAAARPGEGGWVRIELAADTVDVLPSQREAEITVRRRGSTDAAASFTWWTESGTAKPGLDFVPVIPHEERIEAGRSTVNLNVSVADVPRSHPKSFYVVIDKSESGAALGARTLTMVTIQTPD